MNCFISACSFEKIGNKILDYPIADNNNIDREVSDFGNRFSVFLDPKNKSHFQKTYEDLSKKHKKLVEVNERFKSYRTAIKIALNSDNEQTQYAAFTALGKSQMSPMEWNHSSPDESIRLEIANIYQACNSNDVLSGLTHLYPSLTERHQTINFTLAQEYFEKVQESEPGSNEQKYYEALCVFHFAIASELGHKPSSSTLEKICQEGQFSLPENWHHASFHHQD
jgi:tetratricopeptide (TPR) repeat protein